MPEKRGEAAAGVTYCDFCNKGRVAAVMVGGKAYCCPCAAAMEKNAAAPAAERLKSVGGSSLVPKHERAE